MTLAEVSNAPAVLIFALLTLVIPGPPHASAPRRTSSPGTRTATGRCRFRSLGRGNELGAPGHAQGSLDPRQRVGGGRMRRDAVALSAAIDPQIASGVTTRPSSLLLAPHPKSTRQSQPLSTTALGRFEPSFDTPWLVPGWAMIAWLTVVGIPPGSWGGATLERDTASP